MAPATRPLGHSGLGAIRGLCYTQWYGRAASGRGMLEYVSYTHRRPVRSVAWQPDRAKVVSVAAASTHVTKATNETDTPAERSNVAGRRNQPMVVGSRGSTLALWQTSWVLDRLRERAPRPQFRIEEIKTEGDRTQLANVPLTQLGDKSVFIAELERALLAGESLSSTDRAPAMGGREHLPLAIDVAVHSLKDLPGILDSRMALAAITEREDPRDALVSRSGLGLFQLPAGATVATSSLRRRAQVLYARPDLRVVDIRGNVDTRLRKAHAPDGPDATILAVAGLKRLGLEQHITELLPVDVMVPAVGQGALAVEVRASDQRLR